MLEMGKLFISTVSLIPFCMGFLSTVNTQNQDYFIDYKFYLDLSTVWHLYIANAVLPILQRIYCNFQLVMAKFRLSWRQSGFQSFVVLKSTGALWKAMQSSGPVWEIRRPGRELPNVYEWSACRLRYRKTYEYDPVQEKSALLATYPEFCVTTENNAECWDSNEPICHEYGAYLGRKSETIDGEACVPWVDAVEPFGKHTHTHTHTHTNTQAKRFRFSLSKFRRSEQRVSKSRRPTSAVVFHWNAKRFFGSNHLSKYSYSK